MRKHCSSRLFTWCFIFTLYMCAWYYSRSLTRWDKNCTRYRELLKLDFDSITRSVFLILFVSRVLFYHNHLNKIDTYNFSAMIIFVREGTDGMSCLLTCVFICFGSLLLGHVVKNCIPSTHPIARAIGHSTMFSIATLFVVDE